MSFDIAKYPTLALVDSTQELRLLPKESLPKLCDELRRYLLDSVSRSSGHFASGLGTVELTVALHYVYNTPFDQLIWDVGHQAYPHKILTGRRDKIGTIRQKGGLHPFPWRGESEYDVLSVGHSSTSISAGIGIAVAAEKEGKNRRTVCVIGDGAITAGMAFEAMNHAGDIRPGLCWWFSTTMKCRFPKMLARSTTIWRSCFPVSFTLHCAKAEKKFSLACHPLKSCSNVPKNILKAW